jgi:putative endonuclease
MNKKIIGTWGEKIAKTYLERKGYLILETNWRHHHKELDIIAYKNGIIGFEIKTRTKLANLAFTILKAEQVARLRLSLEAYCYSKSLEYSDSRLDLIIITIRSKNVIRLKHYLDI